MHIMSLQVGVLVSSASLYALDFDSATLKLKMSIKSQHLLIRPPKFKQDLNFKRSEALTKTMTILIRLLFRPL